MKGLHIDGAVHKLLHDGKHQQLFQPARTKLTAAGIQAQHWWRRNMKQWWRAAVGIPAPPDSELCNRLLS